MIWPDLQPMTVESVMLELLAETCAIVADEKKTLEACYSVVEEESLKKKIARAEIAVQMF